MSSSDIPIFDFVFVILLFIAVAAVMLTTGIIWAVLRSNRLKNKSHPSDANP